MSSPEGITNQASSVVLKALDEDLVFRVPEVPISKPGGKAPAGGNPEEKRILSLWSNYGGAILREAARYGLPVDSALAVFSVESGEAYDRVTGLVIIRFEPHIFRKKSGQDISVKRQGQKEEWQNLEKAYMLEPDAALLSCSYGLPQLMGFNWPVTRHSGVREMVLAFQRSCEEQVAGFFGFAEKNNLLRWIKKQDWRTFTRYYNGSGNIEVYSGRLTKALRALESLKQRGARFEAG